MYHLKIKETLANPCLVVFAVIAILTLSVESFAQSGSSDWIERGKYEYMERPIEEYELESAWRVIGYAEEAVLKATTLKELEAAQAFLERAKHNSKIINAAYDAQNPPSTIAVPLPQAPYTEADRVRDLEVHFRRENSLTHREAVQLEINSRKKLLNDYLDLIKTVMNYGEQPYKDEGYKSKQYDPEIRANTLADILADYNFAILRTQHQIFFGPGLGLLPFFNTNMVRESFRHFVLAGRSADDKSRNQKAQKIADEISKHFSNVPLIQMNSAGELVRLTRRDLGSIMKMDLSQYGTYQSDGKKLVVDYLKSSILKALKNDSKSPAIRCRRSAKGSKGVFPGSK